MRVVNRSLDESFELVLGDVAPHEAELLRGLPRRLGISEAEFGGWDDYSKLDPMRNLPLYARELCPSVGDERLDAFVLAHRAAGYAGLVIDRLLDGQVKDDEVLLHAARFLVDRWIELLTRASDAPRDDVVVAVSESLERLTAASEEETRVFESGVENGSHYADVVASKTEWLGLATRMMVARHADGAGLEIWDQCFATTVLGLQLLDDALDEGEDTALRGRSMPQCLDAEASSLFIASERILTETAAEARRVGLERLSEFAGEHAAKLHAANRRFDAAAALGAVYLLADVVGRDALRHSQKPVRAILRPCASSSETAAMRAYS